MVVAVGELDLVGAPRLLEALPAGSTADRPLRSVETLRFLAGFDIARDFEPAKTPRAFDPDQMQAIVQRTG